jgi:retinol-binding protein 3
MQSELMTAKLSVGLAGAMLLAVLRVAAPEDAENGFPPPVDAADRTEILSWVGETLSARYVDPETARAMVGEVRAKAAAGAYDTLDAADSYLRAVERDLRAVSDDKHLGLWPERLEDVKDDDADYTPADPDYVEHLRTTNYGFRKVEILPGNVGYIRVDEFAHPALGGPTAVAVMNTVGAVGALIIDLRWNGGGAGLVNLISGYFFDEPTRLNDVWERASGDTSQGWTPEYVPGPSLRQVPLFILISGQTFSAAEDFAYGLQQAGRATVVGERSKGGGHPVEIVRMLRDDMAVAMQVPNARSVNRNTGTSWEGVGVVPDHEVTASQALAAAYEAAADALLERADGEEARRQIEWARLEFKAGLHPVTLTREKLREYAGIYESRSFSIGTEDVLLYHRDAGSSSPMVPMGGDLFRFEGYDGVRFQFERDAGGRVDRVVALAPDGSRTVRRRSE